MTGTRSLTLPSIAIIGAGKVGTTLARVWFAGDLAIVAVASRTPAHAEALADEVGSVATSPAQAASRADLTVITVPDDHIAGVAAGLLHLDWMGKGIIHTSGAHSLEALEILKQRGAMIGSLHPAYPFAGAGDKDMLRGVTFALESESPRLIAWLDMLVEAAEGRAFTLRPEMKPLYHAALAITSNYAVTLYAAGKSLMQHAGASADAADGALRTLLAGTAQNLQTKDAAEALTGPLVRGDLGTIEAHLDALKAQPDVLKAYLALARLTLPLLAERGVDTEKIARLLQNWEGR